MLITVLRVPGPCSPDLTGRQGEGRFAGNSDEFTLPGCTLASSGFRSRKRLFSKSREEDLVCNPGTEPCFSKRSRQRSSLGPAWALLRDTESGPFPGVADSGLTVQQAPAVIYS